MATPTARTNKPGLAGEGEAAGALERNWEKGQVLLAEQGTGFHMRVAEELTAWGRGCRALGRGWGSGGGSLDGPWEVCGVVSDGTDQSWGCFRDRVVETLAGAVMDR